MIALVDYGIGNLRSVEKALQTACDAAGFAQTVLLTSQPEDLRTASKVVLPGVGAFGDGMRGLQERGLVAPLLEVVRGGVPLLGICLGMQLLFETSEEAPGVGGLGLLSGQVKRFSGHLKVPQTGWNQLMQARETPLLERLEPGSYAYFNHSFYCAPQQPEHWLAATEYGLRYASAAGQDRLYGVQFHPEKSQAVGLQILFNFVAQC